MPITLTPNSTGTPDAPRYLTLDEALAVAAPLPAATLPAWSGATADKQASALALASADVDAAGPYQGRRYDVTSAQTLEFPRVPYPASGDPTRYGAGAGPCDAVWDWDATANAAVVPLNVKRAVLYQADYILSGNAQQQADRQAAIAGGVASQSVGGMSESYFPPAGGGAGAGNAAAAGRALLAPRALQLLRQYFLKSGRLL